MAIELTILLSVISVSSALFFGLKSSKRAEKSEVKEDAASMATIMIKLETISTGVTEIKSEVSGVKVDVKELTERVIVNEQVAKSAQKRLDEHINSTK